MSNLWTPEDTQGTITQVIKELPMGAVQTWEGVALLVSGSQKPIYLFVIENQGKNPLLQFANPKDSLTLRGDVIQYTTGETVCHKKFFNRNFVPTFFIFDNYLHAYAFQRKLAAVGHVVRVEKYK